jgi:hypothetical protein
MAAQILTQEVEDRMNDSVRIAKALNFALRYGGIDGAHHKTWVIDQMVRALLGCPMEDRTAVDSGGTTYEYSAQGAGPEYVKWVTEACAGEDGPQTYEWDIGIPP